MTCFIYIDSNSVVTSSWTSRWQSHSTFLWRRLQKMMLLLLQVYITLNTLNNNIINITSVKHSCCSDNEHNVILSTYLRKNRSNIERSFQLTFSHVWWRFLSNCDLYGGNTDKCNWPTWWSKFSFHEFSTSFKRNILHTSLAELIIRLALTA